MHQGLSRRQYTRRDSCCCESDHLVTNTVFCSSESVGDKGSVEEEVFLGSNTGRDMTDIHIKLDVNKCERGVLTTVGAVYSPRHMK